MCNTGFISNVAPLRGAGMGMYVSQGSRRYCVAWSPWAIVITFASQRLYETLLVAWSPWAIVITFASQRLYETLLVAWSPWAIAITFASQRLYEAL